MSRHRVKALSYDDDFEDDYDSADPDEQERLEECTKEVLGRLQAGEPSVTASHEEVQEALWHYYNDIQKSVDYLRGIVDNALPPFLRSVLDKRKKCGLLKNTAVLLPVFLAQQLS
jgi:HBS1-like protein